MTSLMVMGIGNELGGDDGVGCFVARTVGARLETDSRDVIAVDAGISPESYTSVIRRHRPELLVLVDAADMGLPPGAVRLVAPERMRAPSFSTHSMPLSALTDYVGELCGRVLLVGIQPGDASGGEISGVVRRAGEQVAELLLSGRADEIETLK